MDVKDKVEKEKQTSPSSRPRSTSPAKPDHDLKFLSAAKDGSDPRARDKFLSKSEDNSREAFNRQDSKPSLISTSSSSPKVSRKYFTNWKQACDKTKDKTKDFLKRWRTLPESEVLECRAGDMDTSSGEREEKGHGWSVHVWTTWVNRFSEDLECLDIEDEGPDVSLAPVQADKMTLFFSELLDHDKDEVITDQDFDQLCEKMAHFADWSTNSSEYHILLEVKREYIEHFINPLPTKWQEKPYYKRVCVPEGAPGRTGIPDWLARWAIQIGYCKKFQDLPLYLQYFCKILFAVIDRSSSGVITKAALASFYRSVIGLNSSRVDEIIDTAFNRMTSNEYLILDYGTFTHCYANWLLGKNPNGPGQWVLVPPKDSLPQPPFPVDYSALNTEPAKLEPYAPDKKTNRHSVIV